MSGQRGDEDDNAESDNVGNASHGTNPFDPARLRLQQRYAGNHEVRRIVASCPVRKPTRQEFIRVHPEPSMSIELALLELKEERQIYLVEPDLAAELPGDAIPKVLHTTINRHDGLMLWPIRLPDEKGRLDEWNLVAHDAAERARTTWIAVKANMAVGTYDVFEAMGAIPEPTWPDITLERLLEMAFKDRRIEDHDHAVLRRLRGEL